MIESLGAQFQFFVITRDRDATDTRTYSGVVPHQWIEVGKARVFYCSTIGLSILRRVYSEVQPDVISLNSYQDKFTRLMVALRRLGALGATPMLIAPRGEFSPGAMEIKKGKKFLYRTAARILGLYDNVLWQASSPIEMDHLVKAAPASVHPDSVFLTSEINDGLESSAPRPAKLPGSVRLVYLSRISEKKNLHFVLELLKRVEGNITLDIYGPVAPQDAAYWEQCMTLMSHLPAGTSVQYLGPLDHADVPHVLRAYHFFILATRGENYCHAAVEAFVNGTPAILSNETPWVNLQNTLAGFDIPLANVREWITVLQRCVAMGNSAYIEYLSGARAYGRAFSNEDAVEQHIAMLKTALLRKQ